MNLGSRFSEVEDERPVCKGYELVVTNVETGTSKTSGQPMLTVYLDIGAGSCKGFFSKHPLRYYIPYGDDRGLLRLKKFLNLVFSLNEAAFPEDDPTADEEFDEKRLIGSTVGGVLKWDGQYLALNYLTTVERAIEAKVIERPVVDTSFNFGENTDEDKEAKSESGTTDLFNS